MIGGTVYQLCHFCHTGKNDHIANTVYYMVILWTFLTTACGSVVIESRLSY